jgi:TonB family protein
MFGQSSAQASRRQRRLTSASLALHGLLLGWLLHAPPPELLTLRSVALGRNGKVGTRLYWPVEAPDNSHTSSASSATEVYRHQRLTHEKLIWNQTARTAKLNAPQIPLSRSESPNPSQTETLSKLGHGAPVGLPYGALSNGPAFGDEIRPALPVATADPVAFPWELPASEGNVVVEITIDKRGEIVRKTVLQSLGPKLDEKVMAALESWHFHPATRNGVAIPSKQDAIFHFRARG